MDTRNVCRLCLVYKNEIIDFFGGEGIKLNITKILVQHFWFQIHRDDNLPMGICRICWKYVNDFHEFYENIEIIHNNYYDNLAFKNDLKISNIKSETTELNNEYYHSNIEFVEPIVEIKIEHENHVSNVKIKRKAEIKSTSNKTSKSPKTSIKTDNDTKSKARKILSKKLTNVCKNSEQIKKDVLKSVEDIVNDDIIEDKDEFDMNNDNIIHSNDFSGNQTNEKNDSLDKNPVRTAENIQISEFYNLKCEICSSQYSTLFELKKHYRIVHNLKNGYVLCCNKKLFRRCKLLEHILWHTNPNEFTCKVCNQIYANKRALKIHMHFHSTPEERIYICDICGDNFTLRYHLMKHFHRIHLPQKNIEFKCNQCVKSFKKNVLLQIHIRGVHELKNVNVCPVCAKVYKSKQHCNNHYLDEHVNANKPKIKCNLCDSMLKNESGLKLHIRRKHVELPISCKLCVKISPNSHALRKHMRDAHSERKHKCNLCDKAFKRPIALKHHMAAHSGSSYLYTCPYCTTSFNSDANMYSHRKRKHPAEWLEDRQRRLGITATNNYQNVVM